MVDLNGQVLYANDEGKFFWRRVFVCVVVLKGDDEITRWVELGMTTDAAKKGGVKSPTQPLTADILAALVLGGADAFPAYAGMNR